MAPCLLGVVCCGVARPLLSPRKLRYATWTSNSAMPYGSGHAQLSATGGIWRREEEAEPPPDNESGTTR